MSKVGDVVFCVDCDLARSAQVHPAAPAPGDALHEHPRRMATKKDANGNALCAACLDARLLRWRAEFELRQAAPTLSEPTAHPALSAQVAHAPVRKLSAMRIARIRSPLETTPANGHKRSSHEPDRDLPLVPAHVSTASDRQLERSLLQVGAEIGFLRAQELLGELKLHVLAITERER